MYTVLMLCPKLILHYTVTAHNDVPPAICRDMQFEIHLHARRSDPPAGVRVVQVDKGVEPDLRELAEVGHDDGPGAAQEGDLFEV